MKEPALQKADQDKVGRFVIMKMSGESSHLLRSSSFIVYKTLQRNEFASVMLHIMGMVTHLMAISWATCYASYTTCLIVNTRERSDERRSIFDVYRTEDSL